MTIPVYLQTSLARHRRGRLLCKLLEAQAMKEAFPDSGILLMIGQDFQALTPEQQAEYLEWRVSSGRTLLLIPPFNEGAVTDLVDWRLEYSERPVARDELSLPGILADEVNQSLPGTDGAFDFSSDYQWLDLSPNCRFQKQHAATGVFALTVLPLWSISLLGHGKLLQSWLTGLHEHAGKVSDSARPDANQNPVIRIEPVDYTTMVCISAWACKTPTDLYEKLYVRGEIPIFSIDRSTLKASLQRLKQVGFLVDEESVIQLSENGISALEASPYWAYVESLRESL